MEKKIENEMEPGIIQGLYYITALEVLFGDTWYPYYRLRFYPFWV